MGDAKAVCRCPELASAIANGVHIGCGLPLAEAYEYVCYHCGHVVRGEEEDTKPKCNSSDSYRGYHSFTKRPVENIDDKEDQAREAEQGARDPESSDQTP